MDEIDPLSRLNALDEELKQGMRQLPTLFDTLSQRFKDAVPGDLGDVPLDQLYLEQAPLTHHICRIALGEAVTDGRIQRIHRDGFTPVTEEQNRWVHRFLSTTVPDARQIYLDALTRYWTITQVKGQAIRHWLKQLCRAQLHAQAHLRSLDRTLSTSAAEQVRYLTDDHAQAPWRGLLVLHSDTTRWMLPGAFVLAWHDPRRFPHEPVLLNTLAYGLETFDSLTSLHQALAERLEDDRQGDALRMALDPERRHASLRLTALTFEPIKGDLFAHLQAQLERRQRAAVSQAWEQAHTHFQLHDLDSASAHLAQAADLVELLSSQHLRVTRYVQLLERDMPDWMHGLSQAQLLELIIAMRELGLATANAIAPGLPSHREFANPEWLQHYARRELIKALRDLGITLPPERIIITVTSSAPIGPLVNPLAPSGSVAARRPDHTGPSISLTTQSRTLVDLALENISPLDFDYLLTAQVSDDNGHPIEGLTAAKVRGVVRRTNVGGSYGRYLLKRLRYGPEAQWRQERHARLMRAKLRSEALKARYRDQLGSDERPWMWIETVLNNPLPANRPPVDNEAIGVWQLLIRGTPLDGVYLIGPEETAQARPVLLYASNSPTRQSWHWFSDRQAVASRWLNAPINKDYILNHIALAERDAIGRLLGTPILATLVSAHKIKGDFFNNAYRSETRLTMANADALSASNQEVNLQTFTDVAVTLTEVVCMFLPGRIAGVFALTRALWAFSRAYMAIGEEPPEVVLLHAFDGYANLFEASVALATSPLFGKLVRRVPMGTPVPLQTHYALKDQHIHLHYHLATVYAEQVYEAYSENGNSTFFIQDRDGRQYEVLHDGEHWRVVDARMPQAMHKPVVRKNADGEWEMIEDLHWYGITPDIPALLREIELTDPPSGVTPGRPVSIQGRLYVRIGQSVMAVRASLLPDRYTVIIPQPQDSVSTLTMVLRYTEGAGWQAKVRQSNLSSEWFSL